MIHRGDTKLNRFKVLIGQLHIFQCVLQQLRLLTGLTILAIGKTFARLIGICKITVVFKRGAIN